MMYLRSYICWMHIASVVVVWDQWWLLSKYLWIYSTTVWSPPLPRLTVGEVLLFGPAPAIFGATTPSLVIREGEEGSEAVYLIKADWDFH